MFSAKDVSTITKNGDIQIVAAFVADEPEPPGGMSVAAVETASGNGFDVLLTKKLVQTRSYTFLSVPLDTERKVTKLTGFTATSTGVSWSALDEDETVSLLNGEFVLNTPGKKIQFKGTFSQRSDAKPGNAIQGYSAQTVLAPLPSDSLVTEHSYSYDLKGNRSLYDSSGLTYYLGTDRLKQTPTATYDYDDNGNLVEKTTNDGTKLTYIYDVRNLLIEVQKTLSGGSPVTIARYLYDSEGNRIQSTYPADNSTVGYQYDLTRQITENPIIEEQAGSVRNFVYLNRKLLARVDGSFTSGTRYWYLVDHLGSTRKMVDASGNVVWWADYEAFGKVKSNGGTVSEVPRFTGKAWDEKVELYYFNARWDDPETGRFISEDPVADPNNPNLYTYCANNPLVFVDPTGLEVNTTINEDGSRTETETDKDGHTIRVTRYDAFGRMLSESRFDSDGSLRSKVEYTYEGQEKRTQTVTQVTSKGVTVQTNLQGLTLGQWTTRSVKSITGFNSLTDYNKGNWNFQISSDGTLEFGKNVKVANGDLLLQSFYSFLSNNSNSSSRYVYWLFGSNGGPWDVVSRFGDKIKFSLRGQVIDSHTFGNIEVGYISAAYNCVGRTRFASHAVNLAEHPFEWDDELGADMDGMSLGTMLFLEDYWGMEIFWA